MIYTHIHTYEEEGATVGVYDPSRGTWIKVKLKIYIYIYICV